MADFCIDINADLGEFEASLVDGTDFELMRYITSANVACGGHAGNEQTMRQTLAAARKLNVAAGAHPSYPDRVNFGRLASPLSPAEIEDSVTQQIAALVSIAKSLDMELVHVKAHGALYHAANTSREAALAIGHAVKAIHPGLIMIGQAASPALEWWQSMGLRTASEAFADRAYEPDGTLRKRTLPGALIDDPVRAAQQAVDIAVRHRVVTVSGSELNVEASTICIHSDTPGSAAIAREVHRQLKAAGVLVQRLC
ncbi:MAG TPA: 5-oxoprolinase subunit PxpA [Terriglobales bacterium]|nr:5-oxoprolinase subunit PxpA [Terriglobales bacterium]